jgi:hypothetical protein
LGNIDRDAFEELREAYGCIVLDLCEPRREASNAAGDGDTADEKEEASLHGVELLPIG